MKENIVALILFQELTKMISYTTKRVELKLMKEITYNQEISFVYLPINPSGLI